MKYIALNGFRHSLRRYFNSNVKCVERFNWTHANAVEYAKTITEMTCVIGFSDGATAALAMANESRFIARVYAHSPQFVKYDVHSNADVILFATNGDRTGTFMGAENAYDQWETHARYARGVITKITALDRLPHIPIRNLATFIMRISSHQFHNCLPLLPLQIINPDFKN